MGSSYPSRIERAMSTQALTVLMGATAAGRPAAVTFSGRHPRRVRRSSIHVKYWSAMPRSPDEAAVMAYREAMVFHAVVASGHFSPGRKPPLGTCILARESPHAWYACATAG